MLIRYFVDDGLSWDTSTGARQRQREREGYLVGGKGELSLRECDMMQDGYAVGAGTRSVVTQRMKKIAVCALLTCAPGGTKVLWPNSLTDRLPFLLLLANDVGIMPHAELDLTIPWGVISFLLMITGIYGIWALTKVTT